MYLKDIMAAFIKSFSAGFILMFLASLFLFFLEKEEKGEGEASHLFIFIITCILIALVGKLIYYIASLLYDFIFLILLVFLLSFISWVTLSVILFNNEAWIPFNVLFFGTLILMVILLIELSEINTDNTSNSLGIKTQDDEINSLKETLSKEREITDLQAKIRAQKDIQQMNNEIDEELKNRTKYKD